MTVGTRYPSEKRTYRDPQTGRQVTQLTDSPAEDYHLYFYNPSITTRPAVPILTTIYIPTG